MDEIGKIEPKVPADPEPEAPGRAVTRSRAARLVAHASAAKANIADGYGTDITDMASADYKGRIRRLMMRG